MGPLIITYITLFPLLLAVWQERAFTPEDIMPGPYPVIVNPEQIALQPSALRTADRELRLVILRELRQTNREDAHQIILNHLGLEQDPGVLACTLQQLAMSPFGAEAAAGVAQSCLDHPDDDVRLWAAAVLGRLGPASRERLIRTVAEDPQQAVREQAAAGLREMSGGVRADTFQTFRQDPNPRVTAALAVGLCLGPDGDSAAQGLAQAWTSFPAATRFAVVARLPEMAGSLQQALLPLACRDPVPAVRGEAAAVMARLARPADQAAVLELTRDPDPEVRRRAALACRAYPGGEALAALLDRLEDERTLVRRQAEDVLVDADPVQPAGAAVTARLGRTAFPGRAHQCRVLARIVYADSAAEVHGVLRRETEPEGLRDAVFALGRFRFRTASAEIAALGTHASPVVREAVAEALGFLAVPETYPLLQTLAFDPAEPVRQAAILGIGRTGDGSAFGDTIRQVLVQTVPEKMTPFNRAAAAWTAGRLRPVHPELARRLKVQATEPVVPGPMGMPMFEQDFVLVCVDFALAQQARDDRLARTLFEEVYQVHQLVLEPGKAPPPGVKYSPSQEVLEYSRQAFEYLQGTASDRRPRPTVGASFAVDLLSP